MLFPLESNIDLVRWEMDALRIAFIYLSTTTHIASGLHPPADIRLLINNQSRTFIQQDGLQEVQLHSAADLTAPTCYWGRLGTSL